MKTILIYTYKHSNYGAVLQAYALQKYLRETYEADVKIVDFTTDAHLKDDRLIRTTGSIVERVVFTFFNLIHSKELKSRREKTKLFKEQYYVQTDRFSSIDSLISNNPEADIYISGSDQVFNPNSIYLPVYYLGFKKGNGIKVAYAPSFGISKFAPDVAERIKPYLVDFDFISCRETIGADYLTTLLGRTVPTVCDPTLLLGTTEWSNIAVAPNFDKPYILVYEINGGGDIVSIAQKLAAVKGLPIVCITSKTHRNYKVNKIVRDAGPAEFVGWFQKATFVVTDSFHGTVFSWIFEKEFFYFLAYEGTSSRAISLLKHLGCEDRVVTKDKIGNFDASQCLPYQRRELPLVDNSKRFIDSFMWHEQ